MTDTAFLGNNADLYQQEEDENSIDNREFKEDMDFDDDHLGEDDELQLDPKQQEMKFNDLLFCV